MEGPGRKRTCYCLKHFQRECTRYFLVAVRQAGLYGSTVSWKRDVPSKKRVLTIDTYLPGHEYP